MQHRRMKLIIASVAMTVAVGYLAVAGFQEGWMYYVHVDEFLADDDHHDQRVRLYGRVAEVGVESHPGLLTASFDLLGTTQRMAVVYRGLIPDTFKPGCELVLEGRLGDDGVFEADVMMTKCASKYQAEEHAGNK